MQCPGVQDFVSVSWCVLFHHTPLHVGFLGGSLLQGAGDPVQQSSTGHQKAKTMLSRALET